MGGITQSQSAQFDYSKNGSSKQSNSSLNCFQSQSIVDKRVKDNNIKSLDSKGLIFKTIFPHSNIKSTQNDNDIMTLSHCNKSFDNTSHLFNRNKGNDSLIIPICSFHSDDNDNCSEQSDLIDIEESNILACSEIKRQEMYIKNGKKLRMEYMVKLINKNVWQPTIKSKIHNTLFFFDWDDTLMCTSYITPNGQYSDNIKINEKDNEKIKHLDTIVSNIMERATVLGEVYIITNAAPGWVEYSSKRFYPETAKNLGRIKIISARGLFEKKYPGDMKQWKIMAFNEVLKNLDTKLVTNLICLGDSIMEIEAAHIFAGNFTHVYIKTVKFKENPMPIDLHKQLTLVINQLDKIYSSVKNLAIRVENRKNSKAKNYDKNHVKNKKNK